MKSAPNILEKRLPGPCGSSIGAGTEIRFTMDLIYSGRADGWLVVPSLEPA